MKSSKGSAFERDISKYLTEWVTGKKTPVIYWRQISSGGLMKIYAEAAGQELSGDIHALTPEGRFLTDRFSLELKNGYPAASLDKHLKYNTSDEILSFWEQCCDDADKTGKRPLLIYRKKALKPWVGVDDVTLPMLIDKLSDVRSVTLTWPETGRPPLTLFDMEEFFKRITPELMIRLIPCSTSS